MSEPELFGIRPGLLVERYACQIRFTLFSPDETFEYVGYLSENNERKTSFHSPF